MGEEGERDGRGRGMEEGDEVERREPRERRMKGSWLRILRYYTKWM